MKAIHILEGLQNVDDEYLLDAIDNNLGTLKSGKPSMKKGLLLVAIIVLSLMVVGFVAYTLGLFDPWLETPSQDPIESVKNAIENQMDKEYTLSVVIESISIDEDETVRISDRYVGSDLAVERGWTEEILSKYLVVVRARYQVKYDHTKTFLEDGLIEQDFYLMQDEKINSWIIIDNTGGNPVQEE